MFSFFLDQFVFLFVVVDPLAVLPLFMALTQHDTPQQRHHTALKASFISLIILLIFAFVGEGLLDVLRISTPALQLSGGVLLLIAAIDMVIAKHSGITSTTKDENTEAHTRMDVSVFPLAIPLIAGPGALTAVVMQMRDASGSLVDQGAIVLILFLIIGLTFGLLRFASPILRILGVTGTNVMTRVFGIILSALAFQFILSGLTAGLFKTAGG